MRSHQFRLSLFNLMNTSVIVCEIEPTGNSMYKTSRIFRISKIRFFFIRPVFITIDWFDNINRIHNVLKCPLFRIQTSQDIRWRRIFPISIIDHVQKVYFVYDTKIDLWIKNNYYFTAI
ncbi:hypothetical protein GLOIN_2v1886362 [Rhizophagus clarus]|uniref:Uncharacterized protein n=1 Tax=Rhizophagus clarus TaxID=94130 RepID=A0A8H3KWK8_9GLOM|nr:hypothetical protein GLOIN_2v1886362 [Rhizophagus clarus]